MEAGFFMDNAENVQGLGSPRLISRLASPPPQKATGLVSVHGSYYSMLSELNLFFAAGHSQPTPCHHC